MCRMRRFLAILRGFLHSSLLYTFSCHPSSPTILPSSLTSSCHLFLGLPLNLVVPKGGGEEEEEEKDKMEEEKKEEEEKDSEKEEEEEEEKDSEEEK